MSQQELPEPSLSVLISMLMSQAAAAMGQLKIPGQEMPEPRMDYAKHFIELLSVLETKTQGNLTQEEASMLQQALHHLRLTFLQLSK